VPRPVPEAPVLHHPAPPILLDPDPIAIRHPSIGAMHHHPENPGNLEDMDNTRGATGEKKTERASARPPEPLSCDEQWAQQHFSSGTSRLNASPVHRGGNERNEQNEGSDGGNTAGEDTHTALPIAAPRRRYQTLVSLDRDTYRPGDTVMVKRREREKEKEKERERERESERQRQRARQRQRQRQRDKEIKRQRDKETDRQTRIFFFVLRVVQCICSTWNFEMLILPPHPTPSPSKGTCHCPRHP
jgi:hypothetical protein